MRLLVVRHAIAEDLEAFARSHKDDSTRPLTPDGRRKMERAALGLKELVPELDVLAASPYKRAKIGRATSELQSRLHLVCRLLLEKKKRHRNSGDRSPHVRDATHS